MKKGFTLIELLAVIVILSILMIIVIPRTISIISNSKKKAFIDEVRSIYKAAKRQYINDTGTEVTYVDANNDLSVSNNVGYKITIDKDGKIVSLCVCDSSNGNLGYKYSGTDMQISDIKTGDYVTTGNGL